ncbi:cbb3-type cytochrome c oxidase N-terminal domain-containing protein [Hymenobacter sp. H14-R3]|uniref:cbb3-type cytochrome c oxidase N-terminal domain-containing protein n=1 Tax=Hymenobacter sp. H14-R3 TaxID=3046308 RepID=UPI0024B9885E|nr:cbb3-type cytochrome c oxidase N-terminal domain-containing protein [Hymenobacter sp. H14-R3]MDJ0367652.1 cbb3-type cytochrome c oxidase N-terminal domain-containing protein [Hymenobacter sp. H14-R3]
MLAHRTLSFVAAGLLAGYAAGAQTPAAAPPAATLSGQELLLGTLVGLIVLLLLVLVLTGTAIVVKMKPQLRQLYDLPTVHDTWSGQVLGLLVGDARLVRGEYRDELLDHDYDGIHEFDNDLPPWWKWGFAFTVVFAIGYVGYYHVMRTGQLQGAEYAAEMQQAALFVPVGGDDPNQVTTYAALTAPTDLSSGKSIFATNCAPCHGANAEGKVGPNLTDEFWLHGGNVNNVYKTIKFGVNGKGMVAWKGKLSGKQMLQVASYALSLQGSKPANPKAPQGEKEAAGKPVAKL